MLQCTFTQHNNKKNKIRGKIQKKKREILGSEGVLQKSTTLNPPPKLAQDRLPAERGM
jgi:hypothetical protein